MKLSRPSSSETPSPDPDALRAVIIANVLSRLELDGEDRDLATEEINWLFAAIGNFQQVAQTVEQRLAQESADIKAKLRQELRGYDMLIKKRHEQAVTQLIPRLWQEELERSQPVGLAIPASAQQSAQANNRLLPFMSVPSQNEFNLDQAAKQVAGAFKQINLNLDSLNKQLQREADLGGGGKSDIALQSGIRGTQKLIFQALKNLAELMNKLYGILVTSPGQLLEFLGP